MESKSKSKRNKTEDYRASVTHTFVEEGYFFCYLHDNIPVNDTPDISRMAAHCPLLLPGMNGRANQQLVARS